MLERWLSMCVCMCVCVYVEEGPACVCPYLHLYSLTTVRGPCMCGCRMCLSVAVEGGAMCVYACVVVSL